MTHTAIPQSRLESIVTRIPQVSVLVIGDVMLDEYLWGEATRISPEAPVPVVQIRSATLKLGGAANVAVNVRSLGAQVRVSALCGQDENGSRLRSLLVESGIRADGLQASTSRPTTLKTRVIAQHQQIVRTDRESTATLTAEELGALRSGVEAALPDVQAVILSDYAKGVLTPALLSWVVAECRSRGVFAAVDPKARPLKDYFGATVLTPNLREAHQALALPYGHCSIEEIERLGWQIVEKADLPTLLITLGERGLGLFERQQKRFSHLPTFARKVYDVTGAGDTVVAVYSVAVASGASPLEAAFLANHAAGMTVAEIGTASVTSQALLKACLE